MFERVCFYFFTLLICGCMQESFSCFPPSAASRFYFQLVIFYSLSSSIFSNANQRGMNNVCLSHRPRWKRLSEVPGLWGDQQRGAGRRLWADVAEEKVNKATSHKGVMGLVRKHLTLCSLCCKSSSLFLNPPEGQLSRKQVNTHLMTCYIYLVFGSDSGRDWLLYK